MDCPRCKDTLTEGSYKKQIAMLCEKCSGVMVKQRDLFTIIESLSNELVFNGDVSLVVNSLNANGPVGSCPECRTQMEHYGYMGSKDVMIDVCPSCNWLWADPLELTQITQLYISSNRQYEKMRTPQTIDGVGVMAIQSAFFAGFVSGIFF